MTKIVQCSGCLKVFCKDYNIISCFCNPPNVFVNFVEYYELFIYYNNLKYSVLYNDKNDVITLLYMEQDKNNNISQVHVLDEITFNVHNKMTKDIMNKFIKRFNIK